MKVYKILLAAAGLFLLASSGIPLAAAQEKGGDLTGMGLASTQGLGSEVNLSISTPASHEERPAVVYNQTHAEYLVVWHNNRASTKDIYARRVSRSGQLLSWFAVSDPANASLQPSAAYNAINDQYLVVWSQYNAALTRWEIYGRIIAWNAPGANQPFLVASWSSWDLEFPVAVWNSTRNEYMVVWQTTNISSGQLLGIGRLRLTNAGGWLGNTDFITGMGTTNQGSPDIAYNLATDGYLAVWVEPGASMLNVHAGRLNWEGALQGSKFVVEPQAIEQQKPAVTTNDQDKYMVVWQGWVAGDWDIHGKEINSASGAPLPTQYLVAIKAAIDETAPDVKCNGRNGEYVFVWQETTPSGQAIQALRWGTNVDVKNIEVAEGGFGDHSNPAVAAEIPGYLIVYGWQSWAPGSDNDIYARTWRPELLHLPFIQREGP